MVKIITQKRDKLFIGKITYLEKAVRFFYILRFRQYVPVGVWGIADVVVAEQSPT